MGKEMMDNRFRVSPIQYDDTKEWLLHKHYAHRMPSITYAFGLYDDNTLIGVCTYGHPFSSSLKKSMGEKWGEILLELNRLCVNDNLPKNTLSWFVAQTFKQLPKPVPLVSYADSAYNHHGYIYQATNWIYTGLSTPFTDYMVRGMEGMHSLSVLDTVGRSEDYGGGKSKVKMLIEKYGAENVYPIKRSRKHRYFMFLGNKKEVREMRKALTYTEEPYPKGDNIRYDSSYKPTVQLTLF
jgi:hypothetical protein